MIFDCKTSAITLVNIVLSLIVVRAIKRKKKTSFTKLYKFNSQSVAHRDHNLLPMCIQYM